GPPCSATRGTTAASDSSSAPPTRSPRPIRNAAALPGPRPERVSAPAARHVHLPRTLRPDLRRATRSAALNPEPVTALVTRSAPREVLRGVIGGAIALIGHDLTMPERQRRVVRYGVLMTTRIRISALFLVRPEVSEVEDHP